MPYPSWNQVQKSQDMYLEMTERRIRPGDEGDFMGELRSLVHNEWSGGERWGDWAALFERQSPSLQQQGMDYLSQHWRWPNMESLEDVSEAMMHRVMLKCKAVFESQGLWINAAPAEEAAIQQWEQAHGEIPQSLKRFLLTLTAGQPEPDEEMYFFFGETDFDDDTGLSLFFTIQTMIEEFQRSGEWSDELIDGWITHMAQVLEHGEATVTYNEALARALPSASHETEQALRRALVVHTYFEGNHGDSVTLAIRDGVYEGQMLTIDDVMHGDFSSYEIKKRDVLDHNGDLIRPHLRSPFQGWLETLFFNYYLYLSM